MPPTHHRRICTRTHCSACPGITLGLPTRWEDTSSGFLYLFSLYIIQLTSHVHFQSFPSRCNDGLKVESEELGLKLSSLMYNVISGKFLSSGKFLQGEMRSFVFLPGTTVRIRCGSSSGGWQGPTKTVHLLHPHMSLLTELSDPTNPDIHIAEQGEGQ